MSREKGVNVEVLDGFNCTVFAFGQTGTGKTFTLEGDCKRAKVLLSQKHELVLVDMFYEFWQSYIIIEHDTVGLMVNFQQVLVYLEQ